MRKRLILIADGQPPAVAAREGDLVAHWHGRNFSGNQISLQETLDARLLEIRAEHMRWAYEMGKLKLESGQTLEDALKCGWSPSMWWTSLLYERHPKLNPGLYTVYMLRCVELLILENDRDYLELVGGTRVISEILEAMCADRGIGFHRSGGYSSSRQKQGIIAKIYSITPAPLRAIARYAHWWLNIRRRLPFVQKNANAWRPPGNARPTATIATYFPNIDLRAAAGGRFRSRYWESLHTRLNEEAKREAPTGPHFVRWLLIRFPSPELNLDKCLALRNLFREKGEDGLSYNYLEEFLDTGDLVASLKRWLALWRASARVETQVANACMFKNSRLNYWPIMRPLWAESTRGWRCLERCLQNSAFRHYAKIARGQRWTLFPLENCPWERMLTEAIHAQENNGPVFGAQHSLIRPTDFRYFDDPRAFSDPDCSLFQPEKYGGNGNSALSQWRNNGLPESRLVRLEALRYLYLSTADKHQSPENPIPPDPGEPVEEPSSHRLLVLTSFFEDETNAHLELLGQALDLELLKDWAISLKPHPYLPVDKWLNNRPEKDQRHIRIIAGPMVQALKPGTKVWASNSTSAALEAAILGLPILVMLANNDFDLCPIQNVPRLPRSGTIEDVRAWLNNPAPVAIPPGYLDLDPDLRQWQKLLGLGIPSN